MKQSILIIIVIHVFMFSNISSVHTAVTPQTETKEYALDKDQNKQELYKLLYENSVHSNDRMITTMQWSIGLVATFIIVLLGSQVFFNYKISKKEINVIRSELDEKFSMSKSDILEKINKTTKENEKSTRHSFQKLETEIQNNMNSRFKEKEKLFEAKMESFGKDNELLKNQLESKIKVLSIGLNKVMGDVWKLRGVEANALTQFIITANLEIDRKLESKYILGDIKEVLMKLTEIFEMDYIQLEKLMTKIPKENSYIKDEIESLYKALPKYIFIDDPENPGRSKSERI